MEKDYLFIEYLHNKVSESTATTYKYARQQMIKTLGETMSKNNITEYWRIKNPCGVTKAMLQHLAKFNKINIELPTTNVRKKVRLPKYYSNEETNKILSAIKIDCDYYEVIWLMIETGLRISEAINLRWTDLKYFETPPRIFVPATKGVYDRYVYPSPELMSALVARDRAGAYVFASPTVKDSHITPQAVRYHYRRAVKALGLTKDSSPHKHRHTYATTLLKNKVGLRTIQQALGHSSPTTTAIYTHVFPEELEEASKKAWMKQTN
jgi:integrase